MSILNKTVPDPRDVIRRQLLNGARSAYNQFRQSYQRLYRLVWYHPTLTPDEVLAELGTDARDYLTLAYASYSFVNAVSGDDPLDLPAHREITIHDDGTATLAPETSNTSSEAD